MKTSTLLLSSLLLAANAISAAETQLAGVWRGKVGDYPITACFNENQGPLVYYYEKQRKPIQLDSFKGGFEQGKDGERWLKLQRNGKQLRGEWRAANGKTLALALELVAQGSSEDQACANDAFVNGLDQGTQLVRGKEKQFAGHRYRELTASLGSSYSEQRIELLDGGNGLASINRVLLENFPTASGQRATNLSDCQRGMLGRGMDGGEYNATMQLVFWRRDYLTIRTSESGYCGGAHPFGGSSDTVWDQRNGQKVNLWRWFKGMEQSVDNDQDKMPPALHKYLQKQLEKQADGAECQEAVRDNTFLGIALGPKGVRLHTNLPHVVQACDVEIELTPAQLRSFLSVEGLQILPQLYGK